MSAKLKEDEFKDRFDEGESLESLGFDLAEAELAEPLVKRVNVDFPDSVVAKLDRHATLMGLSRQALIKVWIFERLKEEAPKPRSGFQYQISVEAVEKELEKLRTRTAEEIELIETLRKNAPKKLSREEAKKLQGGHR